MMRNQTVIEKDVQELMKFGFTKDQVIWAMKKCENNK